MRRTLFILAPSVLLACSGERTPASDSVVVDTISASDTGAFRGLADSLAEEMARELAQTTMRQGTWRSGDSTSQWTARFQDTIPVIIEERMQVGNRVAVSRAFFFDPVGALEQISEQHIEQVPGSASRVTETVVEAQAGKPVARRTINGAEAQVPADDINALRRRTAVLLELARRQ